MQTTRGSLAGPLRLSGVTVLPLFAADPNPAPRVAAGLPGIEHASRQNSPADPGTADIASSTLRWVGEQKQGFGDRLAMTERVLYGAPPGLQEEITAILDTPMEL